MHASLLQIEFSRSKLNSHIIVSRTVWRLHLLCTKKPCYSAYSLTFYRRVSRRKIEAGWRGERNNYIRCWQQLCVSDNSRKWYWWAVTLSDNSRGIMLPSLSVVFNVGCSNYRCSVVWEQSVTKSLGGGSSGLGTKWENLGHSSKIGMKWLYQSVAERNWKCACDNQRSVGQNITVIGRVWTCWWYSDRDLKTSCDTFTTFLMTLLPITRGCHNWY